MGSRPCLRVCPLIAGTEKATPKASRLKAEGYLNGLKQNAGDTEVILYDSAETARAVGYNPFMPSYPHIEEYRAKLQELIEFGGSDNGRTFARRSRTAWMPTATTTGNDWC